MINYSLKEAFLADGCFFINRKLSDVLYDRWWPVFTVIKSWTQMDF